MIQPLALPTPPPDALRRSAEALEAAFLAEMLKSAGAFRPTEGPGSGGEGEAPVDDPDSGGGNAATEKIRRRKSFCNSRHSRIINDFRNRRGRFRLLVFIRRRFDHDGNRSDTDTGNRFADTDTPRNIG